MSDLALPLLRASPERPGDAFAIALARALRELHVGGGGDVAHADAIERAALRVAEAIQEGRVSVEAGEELAALAASPVVARDGDGDVAPLVLAGERLYLARYRAYERALGLALARRNRVVENVDEAQLHALLDRHFGASTTTDWQKLAAATAALRRLCVISGGPGTGKTTTVVRILAILLTLEPKSSVAIAAPTGKAAARVQESIRSQLDQLQLPPEVAAAMPREPHTLHRLLGWQSNTTRFRHDEHRRLPYDVVVVDEASMLDLALAAKLVSALRDDARLILLGDKDQLSSVEAGAVYAGISAQRASTPAWCARLSALTGADVPAVEAQAPLADAVVWLERSFRFGADSALGRLARAINTSDRPAAAAILQGGDAKVSWTRTLPPVKVLVEHLLSGFAPYIDVVRRGAPAAEVFAAFDAFRVLCSTRAGLYGSERLSALLLEALRKRLGGASRSWFVGRPVMVTANDYALRLFNGDVGIVLPDERGVPVVHFPTAGGAVRRIAPLRLSAVEPALAVTVHRSQGSEFERVAVVVEPTLMRGLSRELLYTAVTRARSGVAVWMTEAALEAATAGGRGAT